MLSKPENGYDQTLDYLLTKTAPSGIHFNAEYGYFFVINDMGDSSKPYAINKPVYSLTVSLVRGFFTEKASSPEASALLNIFQNAIKSAPYYIGDAGIITLYFQPIIKGKYNDLSTDYNYLTAYEKLPNFNPYNAIVVIKIELSKS
jgi:hypothetical protein